MPPPIVTLLTDFGQSDYFVAAMKGVILRRNPAAVCIDITHEISPQNVVSAAYVLMAGHASFPAGTIHVAVVDPGVGSERKPLAVCACEQLFVGPDNGLFSLIVQKDPQFHAYEITNPDFIGAKVSSTFHGRDLFAEAAGALSQGAGAEAVGPPVLSVKRFSDAISQRLSDHEFESFIIHIDHFGNCVTGITRNSLPADALSGPFSAEVRGRRIERRKSYYAESPAEIGAPFLIWGSADFLEISVMEFSAADLLRLKFGDRVRLRVG
jgi:S-adenosyl-L-methionine hydrolase (adenosine-forming)